MNAILKYPGAKWRIARWIIEQIPEHHSYVEPYFGSGAVFFNKAPSNIETINDLDGDVVNFFEIIREDPEMLAEMLYMTPYSRKVYEQSYEPEFSRLRRAWKFCTRINMNHGYRCNAATGWKNDIQGRERAYAAQVWSKMPDIVMQAAERLRGVQIEQRPALDVINRFNNPKCFIYCDPPYLMSTRAAKQYNKEMTEEDHEELLYTLRDSRSKIMISGYESDLYNKVLRDWRKAKKDNLTQSLRKRKEVLWMNY